jgi:Ca2+-binding RTX toxin-like protein
MSILIGTEQGNDDLLGGPDGDQIEGLGGNDRLTGGDGADTLLGGVGNDVLWGGAVDDPFGDAGDGGDWLDGGAGNDSVRGAFGDDTVNGGEGDDTLGAGPGSDLVDGGDGTDWLGINFELQPNAIVFSAAALQAGVEAELRFGDGSVDTIRDVERLRLIGSAHGDSLTGAGFSNVIQGLAGNDSLHGGSASDRIEGGDGDDLLNGGTGADTMLGGAGNDVYYVDAPGDVVTEAAGAGIDLVIAEHGSYTLGAEIEQGRIAVNGAAGLYGNALDNLLYAGNGDNSLYGGSGIDTVSYRYAGAAVFVSLSLAGAQATSGSGMDSLSLIENLSGSVFNDRLGGNAQWNVLDGGVGADTLIGGDGSDTYVVDHSQDVVIETNADLRSGGSDWVHSHLNSTTLGANVEHGLILRAGSANLFGNAANNILVAGDGDNRINGGSGVDTVSYERAAAAVGVDLSLVTAQATGGSGSDTLTLIENLIGGAYADSLKGNGLWNRIDGGLGADTMEGGLGSDSYVFDNAGDVVIERADEGIDWVYSRLESYQLGENIENGAIDRDEGYSLSGNALANVLQVGLGDDTLDGGEGADTASFARASSAVVVQLERGLATGGAGTDTLVSIENLIGSSHHDSLYGDAQPNDIRGGSGSDWIAGGGGNDILRGGGNNQGDGASDSFVFDTAPNGNTNYDRIIAFEGNGIDRIVLDPAIFSAIGAQLDASEFRIGTSALDADDYILFDRLTGNLFYDADGSGAGAKVLFAKLIAWTGSIDVSDFVMPPPGG